MRFRFPRTRDLKNAERVFFGVGERILIPRLKKPNSPKNGLVFQSNILEGPGNLLFKIREVETPGSGCESSKLNVTDLFGPGSATARVAEVNYWLL